MKYLLFSLLAACTFVAFADAAETAETQSVAKSGAQVRKPLTPAERAKLNARRFKSSGGMLVKEQPAKCVCIRNKQTVFTAEELSATLKRMQYALRFRFVKVDGDQSVSDAGIELVLEDKLSVLGKTLLSAPEQGWANVATGWLVADKPDADKRVARLQLELTRALGSAVGVGYAMYQPCVMTTVRSVRDLDRIAQPPRLGPESENNFTTCANVFGVSRVQYRTYRDACREGWAPAPTNDVQRSIWNEVRQIPDKPQTIQFDPKKGK